MKASLISSFPIPNSREDILEFLTLATSQVKPVNRIATLFVTSAKLAAKWNSIWAVKCKQAYTKAKITMSSDPAGLTQIRQFLKEAKIEVN